MMAVRNDWEFRIFGMKRSGHHAIVVWLASHFPQNSVHFINDVVPFLDPFRFHSNTGATTSRGKCFIHRPEAEIQNEQERRKTCLIYSYEERTLAEFGNPAVIPRKSETIGASGREFAVIVLRDPFNTIASRLQSGWRGLRGRIDDGLDDWLAYAREYAGITDHLGSKIPVSFNRWFADKGYRRSLSESLGLAFTDKGLNRIAANGHGSSWDGTAFDRRAQEMKVLERWKTFAADERFQRLFHNRDDVREMSEQIFGCIPGTQRLFGTTRRDVRLRRIVRSAQGSFG